MKILMAALMLAAGSVWADAREEYLEVYRSVDTNRAAVRIQKLWRHEVGQTMSCKRRAAETVVQFLKEDGFSQIESIQLPTDGKTSCQDKRMPLAWEAKVGRLTIVNCGNYKPGSGGNLWADKRGTSAVVADYDVHPYHLVKGSMATPPGGVTARVLSEAQFLAGEDAKGAIIMLEPETWPRAKMLTAILDRGALGFICDQLVGRFSTPDSLQWVTACTETASWSPDVETRPFVGFSVSPRTGLQLRAMAAAGGMVVKAECDGERVATTMPFVTAVVPGRRAEEFWIVSHMYEPFVSDDSCGVVAAIETARRFIGKAKPELTIRVLFGIEYYGYAAYLEHVGCPLRSRVVGGVNCDSIPAIRNTDMRIILGAPATPFYGNLIIEPLAQAITGMPESLDLHAKRMGDYYDDYFMADPTVGVPLTGLLHNFKSGDRYWHNSCMNDAFDAEVFHRSLAFAGTYVARAVNPTEKLLPAARACAEARIARAATEAKSREHFQHLAEIEARQLANFSRVLDRNVVDPQVEMMSAHIAEMAKSVPEGKLADSPWRRYAAGIVPARKLVGFTQDQTRVPVEERMKVDVLYSPLVNAVANMDGKKDLARLLRESEYENAVTLSEDEVARYVRMVCFLGDWGYLTVANRNPVGRDEIAKALAAAGVRRGDLILVEDDLESIGPIAGGKAAVVAVLRAAVGEEGTVLFPAFNPSVRVCGAINRSWDYRPYDARDFRPVAKTSPLAACFLRQTPGALRSAHYVRSWTGFGPLAAECLSAQLAASAPYGADSPIAKAIAHRGKYVNLGGAAKAAEYRRYLACRGKSAPTTTALVGVRQADGSSRDVLVPDCPLDWSVADALDSHQVRQVPLGLSQISVVDIKE